MTARPFQRLSIPHPQIWTLIGDCERAGKRQELRRFLTWRRYDVWCARLLAIVARDWQNCCCAVSLAGRLGRPIYSAWPRSRLTALSPAYRHNDAEGLRGADRARLVTI